MITVDEIQHQIQELNALLDPIANEEIDINDPNWEDSLKKSRRPLDEAGVRGPAQEVTKSILELFLAANSKGRSQIRKLLADNSNFAWAMEAPESIEPEVTFRNRVLLCVINDAADTRDVITIIGGLVEEAQSNNINYRPIMRQVAKVAGTTDHYGFGSMRSVIRKHC